MVFDVVDQDQTEVVVPANLYPDGWNTNCVSGEEIPGTDANSAVNPTEEPTETSGESD